MNSARNQATRFEVVSSRYEGGRLLVTARGLNGEVFEDMPVREPHGFHSRPHAGAVGHVYGAHGNRAELFFMLGSDDGKIPQIEPGEAAMYDDSGKVVRLTASGWSFNMDVTITGNVTISGNATIGGDLAVSGNGTFGGSVVDGDGDGGA